MTIAEQSKLGNDFFKAMFDKQNSAKAQLNKWPQSSRLFIRSPKAYGIMAAFLITGG